MKHHKKERSTLDANPDVSYLHARMANGQVKPEARDEMERFEVLSRQAIQESQGGPWE